MYTCFYFSDLNNAFLEKSDCDKLTKESKDLLCKACELAQSRCSKIIIMRSKVLHVFFFNDRIQKVQKKFFSLKTKLFFEPSRDLKESSNVIESSSFRYFLSPKKGLKGAAEKSSNTEQFEFLSLRASEIRLNIYSSLFQLFSTFSCLKLFYNF